MPAEVKGTDFLFWGGIAGTYLLGHHNKCLLCIRGCCCDVSRHLQTGPNKLS